MIVLATRVLPVRCPAVIPTMGLPGLMGGKTWTTSAFDTIAGLFHQEREVDHWRVGLRYGLEAWCCRNILLHGPRR